MNNNLAIVIPAYKDTFLRAALDSLVSQTCKDFTLYIGDDCSPYNLETIVNEYFDKLDIVYNRFERNLGGTDLVAQWERCIDLSKREKYIWLFSDDDVLDESCVDSFYKTLSQYPNCELFRFNLNQLDNSTMRVKPLEKWPSMVTTKDYIDRKVSGKGYNTYVVEFIFSRTIFYKVNRFQNYDLAWGSDFITWVKLSSEANGIRTIENARVTWRSSNENISPNKSNAILYRKVISEIKYTKWIGDFAKEHNYGNPWFYNKYAIGELRRTRRCFNKTQRNELYKVYCDINKLNYLTKVLVKILISI